MHEIGVQALRTERQAVEQRVRRATLSVFQPMCGIFRFGSLGAMRSTSPAIQPSPAVDLVFAAALGQQLHADADAEERPAFAAHRFLERRDHAGDGVETAPAIGEGADAGQHHPVGRRHDRRIVRHHDRLSQAGISRAARSNALAAECRLPEP